MFVYFSIWLFFCWNLKTSLFTNDFCGQRIYWVIVFFKFFYKSWKSFDELRLESKWIVIVKINNLIVNLIEIKDIIMLINIKAITYRCHCHYPQCHCQLSGGCCVMMKKVLIGLRILEIYPFPCRQTPLQSCQIETFSMK